MFRKWKSPADVFQLLKRLTAGQPCDISGIEDYEMLDRCGGIQWPLVESDVNSATHDQSANFTERRLFEDGQFFHADGRARFVCEQPQAWPEPPSQRFPFVLLTGRGTAAQWHTQTRTGKSAVLQKLFPAHVYVEINPQDAKPRNINPGDMVTILSQRGRIQAGAFLTTAVQPGQLFIPMHYEVTNLLTDAAFDPYSHQPAYKACAVQIEN